MKASKKMVIVLLLMLVAVSGVGLLTGSASAAGGLACNASISAQSSAVAQETSYTFTISNSKTSTTTLGSANITIPSAYSNFGNIAITQQPASQNWNITLQTIKTGTKISYFILLYGSTQGLNPGQGITFTLDARNPLPSGSYKWIIGVNENTTEAGLNVPQFTVNVSSSIAIGSISDATLILILALGIAFINTALNRVLINYFVGWEQYRVMQKEMNEYRQETMAAARANDKKQMEKLKKRQSQINNMQAKMLKPQMVQLAISFLYILVWFGVLLPAYGSTSMVYLPGIGALPVIWWYPIASFFLGLLASRILGIMPIEP
jgi:uncharacterized membrane protein (DUF106 family)